MDATILPMMGTLAPYIREYLRGRVARHEITAGSAADMGYCLSQLDLSFGKRPLQQFGPKAIDRWLESIGHLAPATRRQYVSRARGFSQWMIEQRYMQRDPTAHVPAIKQPRQVPKTLTEEEVCRLVRACPDKRARAIVWLMIGCGCRCVEVARLQVDDYRQRERTLLLRGKAGHERLIPVPRVVARAIEDYLDEAGWVGGPLIRNQIHFGGLSARSLSGYVRRWMRDAGIKARALDGRSAHGLRRTAGSDVMERTGDIRVVQEMLGHARVETTAKHYLRPVSMDVLRDAMEGRDYVTKKQVAPALRPGPEVRGLVSAQTVGGGPASAN